MAKKIESKTKADAVSMDKENKSKTSGQQEAERKVVPTDIRAWYGGKERTLDAHTISYSLINGILGMLGDMEDQDMAADLESDLISGAYPIDPEKATNAEELAAIKNANFRCMLAQMANSMVITCKMLENLSVRTDSLETVIMMLAKDAIQRTTADDEPEDVREGIPEECVAELRECEVPAPMVTFNNCQIGTVVNGPYHDNIGGNIQNFSADADEEIEEDDYDDDDTDDEADDCDCCSDEHVCWGHDDDEPSCCCGHCDDRDWHEDMNCDGEHPEPDYYDTIFDQILHAHRENTKLLKNIQGTLAKACVSMKPDDEEDAVPVVHVECDEFSAALANLLGVMHKSYSSFAIKKLVNGILNTLDHTAADKESEATQ